MYQYSFANVDLTLRVPNLGRASNPINIIFRGYGAGEGLINIARRSPIATTQFGAYGDMVVSMQRILAGDLSFTLLMNSPENKYLQDYANYFQQQADADGQLVEPIQGAMFDLMGKDTSTFTNGVILAMPSMVRGQTMNTLTWVISFEKIVFERLEGDDFAAIGEAGGVGIAF